MERFDPIRFGGSTNLLNNPKDIVATVNRLRQDFSVIELEMEDEPRSVLGDPRMYDETVQSLLRLGRSAAVSLSVHAPYVGEDCDLASADAEIRQRSMNLIRAAIRFTSDVGATRLTYHPGYRSGLPARTLLQNLMRSLDELVPEASDQGVTLSLENMGAERPHFIVFSPVEHRELCENTGTRLTFDIVHHSSLVSSWAEFTHDFSLLYPYIENIHLSDAVLPKHVHLPLGCGTIPVDEVLSFLVDHGYSGNVIVEEMGGGFPSQVFIERASRYRGTLFALASRYEHVDECGDF
ncbi:MAG: sugar phosphate isomerase/epimerase [Acidobacteria bacterium]|nr:sugar phosphate isomerase/epimerase [Acidobacteriota bacterium]